VSAAIQLRQLGWELACRTMEKVPEFKAWCGNFASGPWRTTPEAVLNDVIAIKCRENAESVGPQKARW
jgi:hypothetical protein